MDTVISDSTSYLMNEGYANDAMHHLNQAVMDSLVSANKTIGLLKEKMDMLDKATLENSYKTDNLWMMIATGLVFIMHLGFATLESGLTTAKNTINVLFKNTFIPCISLLTFAFCGFGLMYPGFEMGVSKDFIGFNTFGISLPPNGDTILYNGKFTFWTDFLFQGMFAATCATIVSGAVAERIKLTSFIVFSLIYVTFVYPIIGSWKWGYGWLNTLGFYDFAGSTLVHSVGGCGALAGVLILGPRIGKYHKDRINPIPGHSATSAVIGTFMLWLGWFGFNGGSVLSAAPGEVSRVLVMTSLAAAAGGVVSSFFIYILSKKFDISMVLNGILAGLVGITAGADKMGVLDAVFIGSIAGILVVSSVLILDKWRVDDPVGAISVHLVGGIWGTLAVGLFGDLAGLNQLTHQLIGIISCNITAFVAAYLIFLALKHTMGLRVSEDHEINGLDLKEHGVEAYPNFSLK
ncbi:MAG TPA: ammonium transporter [Cytophagaceae bacterium]|jgi:Amt family ammonium transporter|nr:ammonium transporter [Cytophagaceae bacterium]